MGCTSSRSVYVVTYSGKPVVCTADYMIADRAFHEGQGESKRPPPMRELIVYRVDGTIQGDTISSVIKHTYPYM